MGHSSTFHTYCYQIVYILRSENTRLMSLHGGYGRGKRGNLEVYFSRRKTKELPNTILKMFLHGEFTTNKGKLKNNNELVLQVGGITLWLCVVPVSWSMAYPGVILTCNSL